jgi:NADH-quinone oxidoreductase subunit E
MSVRRLAPAEIQPKSFAFTADNENWAAGQIAKYPEGRQASAVIPLLWRAQEQEGWVTQAAIETIADKLGMAKMRVLEVATFYTMFNLEPVGKYFIQLCGTTPCRLRGAEGIIDVCRERIGEQHHVTQDGMFSWLEVECLGACCNAPMVQINQDYFEDLTPASFNKLLDDLAAGKPVKVGPQSERQGSEPAGAVKTLLDGALYDGSAVGAWRKAFDERFEKAQAAKAEAARAKEAEAAKAVAPAAPVAAAPKAEVKPADAASVPVSDEHKPQLLSGPRGDKGDDLELIWGVGPKLAAMLHDMGVYHFDQIAGWTEMNLAWVDQHLGTFKGRALRDNWIEQAKKLATGWRPDGKLGDRFKG